MLNTIKDSRAMVWTFLATLLRVGNAAIVLPLALVFLSSVEIVVFLAFVNLTALTQVLDFGISNTVLRKTAYAYSGAAENRYGVAPVKVTKSVNENALAKLIKSSKLFYVLASCMLAIIFFLVERALLAKIPGVETIQNYRIAWFFYGSAFLINFYFSFMNAISFGRGDVAKVGRVNSVFGALYVCLGAPALLLGYGLLGVGVSALLAAVISRSYSLYVYSQCNFTRRATQLSIGVDSLWDALSSLTSNAWRFGLIVFAVFCITRAPFLYLTREFGDAVTSLVISWQILILISVFSQVPYQVAFPKLNENFVKYGFQKNRNIFPFYLMYCLMTYTLIATAFFLAAGLLRYLLPDAHFIGDSLTLVAIFLIGFLEVNHGVCSNLVTVENKVPMYKRGLLAAMSVCLLTHLFIFILEFPIESVLLAIFLSQLSFNNLYWPLLISSKFKTSPLSMYSRGFASLAYVVRRRISL